jgi:Mlc titration factor MtfA (ptsG expression regulator)
MLSRLARALRERREAAALARRPVPADLWRRTLVRYPFLKRSSPEGEAELLRLTRLFLDRKEFHAVGGLVLRDHIVIAIAAQACLPVLRLGLDRYDGFVGIVLHPDRVQARRSVADEAGVVDEYDEWLAGEAMEGGPVMLSWRDVQGARGHGGAGAAYNVVIHEFAHVLDMADGVADGLPPLPAGLAPAAWQHTLAAERQRFAERVEAGEPTLVDAYGADADEEFFAVASEAFFVQPERFAAEHAALHALFVRFYGFDPTRE